MWSWAQEKTKQKKCCTDLTLISIIIIITIMSYHKHGHLWPSLVSSHYRSSPLESLQGYIPYPHIAAVCMFELVVLLLPGHMWGSMGVHHLWARPCFSSSVLCVWSKTSAQQTHTRVCVRARTHTHTHTLTHIYWSFYRCGLISWHINNCSLFYAISKKCFISSNSV